MAVNLTLINLGHNGKRRTPKNKNKHVIKIKTRTQIWTKKCANDSKFVLRMNPILSRWEWSQETVTHWMCVLTRPSSRSRDLPLPLRLYISPFFSFYVNIMWRVVSLTHSSRKRLYLITRCVCILYIHVFAPLLLLIQLPWNSLHVGQGYQKEAKCWTAPSRFLSHSRNFQRRSDFPLRFCFCIIS